MTDSPDSILNSWRQEKEAAYLYQIIATRVSAPRAQTLFKTLSIEAEKQAEIWGTNYQATTTLTVPNFNPSIRSRSLACLIRWFGPKALRKILSAAKIRGMSIYEAPLHHATPNHIDDVGQRHQSSEAGNRLRAGIFGINDGLISNASLILGLSGAAATSHTLLIAGLAGLFAGAFSMASGEYISVRSQSEMLAYQIELERKELALYPEEEAAELALIYEARGLSKVEAEALAHRLIQDSEHALQTLIREELGLNPLDLASPWGAAITSFLSFTLGALIPLLPLLFDNLAHPLRWTILLSSVTLFMVGTIVSLFSGRGAIKHGLRMLSLGLGAGALTYVIGLIFTQL